MRALLLSSLLLLAGCPGSEGNSALALNEFVARNTTGVTDSTGDTPDWIELINLTDSEVSLDGWAISDDGGNPLRHPLDGLAVPAGGYLLLFADDTTTGGPDHLTFALERDGEELLLSDADGVVDQITFGVQTADVALARLPDGTGDWVEATPTPGVSNQ